MRCDQSRSPSLAAPPFDRAVGRRGEDADADARGESVDERGCCSRRGRKLLSRSARQTNESVSVRSNGMLVGRIAAGMRQAACGWRPACAAVVFSRCCPPPLLSSPLCHAAFRTLSRAVSGCAACCEGLKRGGERKSGRVARSTTAARKAAASQRFRLSIAQQPKNF